MSEAPRDPPGPAVSLLRWALPDDVVGSSILGDLYEEYDEIAPHAGVRADAWFWRSALVLTVRYALVGARTHLTRSDSLGGVVMESWTTLSADVRFGIRMLAKTPLLSLVAILTIGLGVALTTHTFSSVHGAILRGVPVPDNDRLVYVGQNNLELGFTEMEMSLHDFEDLREQQTSFDGLAAFYQGTTNVAGEEGPPERFAGTYVSSNFFDEIDVRPALGRSFRVDEEGPDSDRVIVIGHHVWQNRFAGDPGIVGQSIRVNGVSTEIIGVMPEGFRFPFLEDAWLPYRMDAGALERGAG
ncbi:MAG: hypothetical protein HKN73_01790, partial [Gemmatimonadetes bacterium]|nr:hypothetical protein [Gemmatimonadota bacterium]